MTEYEQIAEKADRQLEKTMKNMMMITNHHSTWWNNALELLTSGDMKEAVPIVDTVYGVLRGDLFIEQ